MQNSPAPESTTDWQAASREAHATLENWLADRATRQAAQRERLQEAFSFVQRLREEGEPTEFTHNLDQPPEPEPAKAHVKEVEPFDPQKLGDYQRPGTGFLRAAGDASPGLSAEQLEGLRERLQRALDNFAIDALVADASVGPRVTQFRVKPGYGTKVEAIANLDKNFALALASGAVRIQAPIPGEPFVGIEVPNPTSRLVDLRGVFEGVDWANTDGDLPLVLGVDITGRCQFIDLAKAPHLLIAGATGSGKSVCINNLILSLLYRFRPDELELVLVDPKKVEFAMYQKLPHLIHPVVDKPSQAVQALKWLVREMETRYELLAEKRVRNLAGYNSASRRDGFAPLPYIVLIVDELADLMMTSKEDVEMPIARLAQMSRAVGIHTVLATQRPSVNVITGVIKANYPARVAFKVSSQVDSRTILDAKGAESLQGKGDMLYNPPGLGGLVRLQSPFVDDDEINGVTDFLRSQLEPRYRVELHDEDDDGTGSAGANEDDPLIKQAIDVIATSQRASTSFLQRRLKIGYNRAANLIEELEKRGYLGPQIENQPREIFIPQR
ncbi:MAG: DNA translocase FtsK [Opitutales bacterium]